MGNRQVTSEAARRFICIKDTRSNGDLSKSEATRWEAKKSFNLIDVDDENSCEQNNTVELTSNQEQSTSRASHGMDNPSKSFKPPSGKIARLFPVLATKGALSVIDIIVKYKELGGALTETELKTIISRYDKEARGVLKGRELIEVFDELKLRDLARAKVQESHRDKLPPHLLLGLSLEGMEEFINALPEDAVHQCNEGSEIYPHSSNINGYVNQYYIAKASEEDGLTVCQRMKEKGSPHVGTATVFVSWFLQTPIKTLMDALRVYLKEKELPMDTKFWVSDFVMQTQSTQMPISEDSDVKRLGDCVRSIGHTVLLIESWDRALPLRRAYCIKELYNTHAGLAQFDVVMSSTEQEALFNKLLFDFDCIEKRLSNVNLQKAECLKKEEAEEIREHFKTTVGFEECNRVVTGLMYEALLQCGRSALKRMPAKEGSRFVLMNNMAKLLENIMDEPYEAINLYKEALEGRRDTLGNRHTNTLTSMNNLASLLKKMEELEEANELYEEVLQGKRETLGDRHPSTLLAINTQAAMLRKMNKLPEARRLYEEALKGKRETLGDIHPNTLKAMNNLAGLLKTMGELDESERLYRLHEEALEGN